MGDLSRPQLAVYAAAALAIVLIGARYLHESRPTEPAGGGRPVPVRVSNADGGWAVVQVADEVHHPGVYRLRSSERVDDAVRMAGGATPRADLSGVNLAAKVEDGRQVIVPPRGQGAPGAGTAPGTAASAAGGRRDDGRAAQPQHRHRRAARPARRGRTGHRAQDHRLPPAARRVPLGLRARSGAGHRPEADGRAQGPPADLIAGLVRAGGSAAAAAAVAVRAHPRHLVIACLVAGLLAFGSRAVVLAAAALAAALGGRRTALGPVAAAVVLAGALVARARVHALDRTALEPLLGHEVTLSATLLERPRRGAFGTRSALVALASGRGRGERVVLRL